MSRTVDDVGEHSLKDTKSEQFCPPEAFLLSFHSLGHGNVKEDDEEEKKKKKRRRAYAEGGKPSR